MEENLLKPLEDLERYKEEIEAEVLEEPKKIDVKIPIPNPAYLLKESKLAGKRDDRPLAKYTKEYDEFCRWSALPKDLRNPKTALLWEKKNMMPRGYTQYFKQREDFTNNRLTFFWEWMMDVYPDVVYAVYQRATNKTKGSDKAAGIFIELLSRKMNLDKPKVQVQPMILMGIEQAKIDAIFMPKDYDNKALIPTTK